MLINIIGSFINYNRPLKTEILDLISLSQFKSKKDNNFEMLKQEYSSQKNPICMDFISENISDTSMKVKSFAFCGAVKAP